VPPPPAARTRLALENDDRRVSPEALLPLGERLQIPLVYDVHHHRCTPEALRVAGATHRAAATWGDREPHFHLSSPRAGWDGGDPRPHADHVIPTDIPDAWRGQRYTVDVETRAKVRAVIVLRAVLDDTAVSA
jgi:UV DNA damage endonuclease